MEHDAFGLTKIFGQDELTERQIEARDYHDEGLSFQKQGDVETAMDYFKKAIVLDPFYSVAYNDLGILYEATGDQRGAEEMYLKALNTNPSLLSAYSNLAMLYESQRDLKQAAYYWQKRASLGLTNDSWTQKAQQRFKDIEAILFPSTAQDKIEKEALALSAAVAKEKAMKKPKPAPKKPEPKTGDAAQVEQYFNEAKALRKKGEEVAALKKAVEAQQLDQDNDEINAFVSDLQHKLLTRKTAKS